MTSNLPTIAAVDVELIKNVALGVSGGSLVIGLILMKVISSIVGKIISSVLMVAIALGGWSQRTSIIDCADKVTAQATAGTTVDATCTFFGQDITVKVPLPQN